MPARYQRYAQQDWELKLRKFWICSGSFYCIPELCLMTGRHNKDQTTGWSVRWDKGITELSQLFLDKSMCWCSAKQLAKALLSKSSALRHPMTSKVAMTMLFIRQVVISFIVHWTVFKVILIQICHHRRDVVAEAYNGAKLPTRHLWQK